MDQNVSIDELLNSNIKSQYIPTGNENFNWITSRLGTMDGIKRYKCTNTGIYKHVNILDGTTKYYK